MAAQGWATDSRIGIELGGLPQSEATTIAAAAGRHGTTVGDCTQAMRLLRMRKTPQEVELMRRAAVIGEQTAAAALPEVTAGTRIVDVRQRFAVEVAGRGVQLEHFAFAPQGMILTEVGDYVAATGDTTFVDYGCIYQGYYSDSGVTLTVGALAASCRRDYDLLGESMAAGLSALRPGTPASQVQAIMAAVTRRAGFDSFPHGHGLGLEMRDYPILVPDTGLRIRDDFVDEPADL